MAKKEIRLIISATNESFEGMINEACEDGFTPIYGTYRTTVGFNSRVVHSILMEREV